MAVSFGTCAAPIVKSPRQPGIWHLLWLASLIAGNPGCAIQRIPAISPAREAAHAQLPFKGRLVLGNAGQLPAMVTAALDPGAPIAFAYREELVHDHSTVPMFWSAINPLTYFGAPLGTYGVIAQADLIVSNGGRVLGDYTAQIHKSARYGLYGGPTYRELDEAAKAAVREAIDEELTKDLARLSRETGAASQDSSDIPH